MAKGKIKILNAILTTLILITALLVIGAGCEKEITGAVQQPPQKTTSPQMQMLFSDDFSQYGKGSTPSKWNSIMEDKLQASITGTAQESGKYGNVVNIKGRILTTGEGKSWGHYTLSLDFQIKTAADRIGPEIAFYVQNNAEEYYLISSEIGQTGVDYYLYRVMNGKRYQIRRRADYNIVLEDNNWHHLELSIDSGKGELKIDSVKVFEFETDGKIASGGVGLATDPYGSVYFDNVAVIGYS